MIPIWLEHTGSHAFHSRTLFIDFRTWPQIVAVTGKIGVGKTTIFNLMHAARYGGMPDRPGPLHKKFLSDGFIDFGWMKEPGGTLYRSRIDVDVAHQRTEGNIYEVPDNNPENRAARKPHLAGPLMKSYLKWVADNLRSEEMVLASEYAIQKQREDKGFLSLERAARRELMAEMLGLRRYPRFEGHFTAQRKESEGRHAVIRTKIAGLHTRVVKGTNAQDAQIASDTHVQESIAAVLEAETTLTRVRDGKARAEGEHAALQDAAAEHDRLVLDLAAPDHTPDLTERLSNNRKLLANSDRIRRSAARETEIRTDLAQIGTLRSESQTLDGEIGRVTAAGVADRARVADQRALLGRRAEIRAALDRKDAIDREFSALDREIDDAAGAYTRALSAAHAEDRERQASETAHTNTAKEINGLRESVATIDVVPCHAVGEFSSCPFLVRAIGARDRIPAVETEMETLRLKAAVVVALPDDASAPLRARRKTLVDEATRLKPTLDLAAQVAAAEGLIAEIERGIEDALATLARLEARRSEIAPRLANEEALKTELATLTAWSKLASKIDDAPQRIRELENQIELTRAARTRSSDRLSELGERVRRREVLALEIADLSRQVADAESSVTYHRRILSSVADERAARGAVITDGGAAAVELVVEEKSLADEAEVLSDYTLLARAYGPTGIPTFRIDAALPEMNARANDLLRECYGREIFTLKVSTQRESADGRKMLEDLDIMVLKDGRPMDVDDLSGGQEVLVKEAVSIAFALYNAGRTGQRAYTLFRDEVSAPISPAEAPLYTQMLRRACQIGGFHRVLFITHHRGCVEKADAELVVENETITIQSRA